MVGLVLHDKAAFHGSTPPMASDLSNGALSSSDMIPPTPKAVQKKSKTSKRVKLKTHVVGVDGKMSDDR